ncbi:MAG: hypothetical protein A2015_09510 [Spirochaetes bacterium GWF1_31_7]|nr:MAG: hypothetical protein A2Y30_01200 [Spirochaetes bacterium GWE1_32_154]OHD45089.1 MAG: hypothetical protein A2Y29_15245 [Spirochaetes bacterium GWE2_31_10]OHD52656.1 MAG: hypothetical protein A2015_09510 [Spirochaetes bacterium GWF1_31_7]OHD75864.1 MAG: hypothetical protein A2355_04115 [Spirochaetes bacterium RIFOXYB1_FULL_32_8]HBD95236.1 hypothetical protein [Spirochaetia bacterium]
MTLIKAKPEHTDELVAMNNQLVIDEQFDVILPQPEMISRMKDFITGEIYDCYLITENDTICGYSLVDKTKTPVYLRHIFIKNQFRNKGLGRNTIIQLLDIYGSNALDIEVMAWNTKAIGFYEKMGFTCRFHGMRIKRESNK